MFISVTVFLGRLQQIFTSLEFEGVNQEMTSTLFLLVHSYFPNKSIHTLNIDLSSNHVKKRENMERNYKYNTVTAYY